MKKLLIASTALVATAGIASADITISGHAAAGIYSNLHNKNAVAAVAATKADSSGDKTTYDNLKVTSDASTKAVADKTAAGTLVISDVTTAASDLLATNNAAAVLDALNGTTKSVGDYSADGVYSNAGVDFTMTGATDNGISFSASLNIDAGQEIDAGDFELDGPGWRNSWSWCSNYVRYFWYINI